MFFLSWFSDALILVVSQLETQQVMMLQIIGHT